MNFELSGKRAIVTGGSRGIGNAVIDNLTSEGVHVATCARGQQALIQANQYWQKNKATVYAECVDVTDKVAFAQWFNNAVEQLGGLDILISNVTTRIDSTGLTRWQETFEVDLLQHIHATELALPHLKNGKQPAIVYVASIASIMTANMSTETEYGSMKAALVSYATQLANQLGEQGIRVNLVSPGPVHHQQGFWEVVKQQQPELFAKASAVSVFNRMGTPTEIANAITFLACPLASNITAANLRVDGGAIKTVNF